MEQREKVFGNRGKGRRKGQKNRATKALRAMEAQLRTTVAESLEQALHDPRGGAGNEFWIKLKTGTAEDRRTFANATLKLIPQQLEARIEGGVNIVVNKIMTIESEPAVMHSARPPHLENAVLSVTCEQ